MIVMMMFKMSGRALSESFFSSSPKSAGELSERRLSERFLVVSEICRRTFGVSVPVEEPPGGCPPPPPALRVMEAPPVSERLLEAAIDGAQRSFEFVPRSSR